MLDADHLSACSLLVFESSQLTPGKLPEGAILLNVGRGDLIRSGERNIPCQGKG